MELNKIYNCDCLEFMKGMPDKSVDLVLTDPPYGIGEANGKNHSRGKYAPPTKYPRMNWDNKIPEKEVFEQILRVSENTIIFGGNYFGDYLGATNCWIVWDKDNGNTDFADCELAWTNFKSAVRKFKWRWNGMLQEKMDNKEKRFHPTQKPVPLFRWLLEKYSNESDIIFDPFMGSGTTAVAAYQTGRNFIGCETSKEYCDIANKRVSEEMNNLFEINRPVAG